MTRCTFASMTDALVLDEALAERDGKFDSGYRIDAKTKQEVETLSCEQNLMQVGMATQKAQRFAS